MCLATINPICARPTWFAKKLASTFSKLIHPEITHEVGMYLVNK